jgi:hypothetical protein
MRDLIAGSLCIALACSRDRATDPWENRGGSLDWPAVPQSDLVTVTDWSSANELLRDVAWLGLGADRIFRRPVVAYLEFEPTALFVSCFSDR